MPNPPYYNPSATNQILYSIHPNVQISLPCLLKSIYETTTVIQVCSLRNLSFQHHPRNCLAYVEEKRKR